MAAAGHPRRYPGTRATRPPSPGHRGQVAGGRPADRCSLTLPEMCVARPPVVKVPGPRPARPLARRHRFVVTHKDHSRLPSYAALVTDNLPAAGRATPAGAAASPRDLGRENMVLRELVTVYRQLSGLALQ